MKKTLKEISSHIGGTLVGDPKVTIKEVSGIEGAQPGSLTFVADEKAVDLFERSGAAAAIVPQQLKKFPSKPHIKVTNFRFSMANTLALFEQKKQIAAGIHKTAVISKSAKIGAGCTVMAWAVIGDDVTLAANVKVHPGCYVGNKCTIGRDTVLFPNVVIYDNTVIGIKCIVHAGAVIGVDGFGFAPVDGKYEKIPQIGNVVIEDDVEIFANTCISRATIGSTVIKKGTKIDNLTHIAHNCKIGENCAITALVAIAGSSELKDHVSIGGTSGVSDHVVIGENTVIMGRSGVTKDIPANSVVSGFPAQDHKKEMELQASLRRIPRIIEKLTEIEKNLKKQ